MQNISIKNFLKFFSLQLLRNKYHYEIKREKNLIYIKGKCDEFDLRKLNYVYLVKDPDIRNNNLTLYLNDFFKIGLNYKGFTRIYQELSKQFGFNDQLFFNHLCKKKPFSVEIWRKKQTRNYQILDDVYVDYTEGFEILSPQKQFIPWGTTYTELFKIKSLKKKDFIHYEFEYPIRVGRLLLDNVYVTPAVIKDTPVLKLYVNCYHQSATDLSYTEIKNTLTHNNMSSLFEKENEKSLNTQITFGSLEIGLHYSKHTRYYFDQGYTKLEISDKNEYLRYIANYPYEEKLEISNYLIIDSNELIKNDFTSDKNIKRRPPKIKSHFGNDTVIWVDNSNKKIGFTSDNKSIVLNQDSIKNFVILNIKTTRKNNRDILIEESFTQEQNRLIFEANYNTLKKYVNDIKRIANKDVVIIEDYIEDV
ncbi:hypothetical protein A1D29_07840 [Pasteurellaceae bacterium Orientalotternb1]|nr:hypothetical protein A1D29_07840 [Pasteurellaceae bacterium Orientalotternb1]